MKKLLFVLVAIGLMAGFSNRVVAQVDTKDAGHELTLNLPVIAIMDIEGAAPTLTLLKKDNAGEALASVSYPLEPGAGGSWINYTSILASTTTNKITVVLTALPPTGTALTVVAGENVGGSGTVGTQTAVVTPDATA